MLIDILGLRLATTIPCIWLALMILTGIFLNEKSEWLIQTVRVISHILLIPTIGVLVGIDTQPDLDVCLMTGFIGVLASLFYPSKIEKGVCFVYVIIFCSYTLCL